MPEKIIITTAEGAEGKDFSTGESIEKSTSKKPSLWNKVMEKGRTQEKGIAHTLSQDEVVSIVATAQAMGCNDNFVRQLGWDLDVAKYKIYDEIGMLLTGRNKGYGETDEESRQQFIFTEILARLYLTGTIKDLVKNLREEDYLCPEAVKRLMDRSKKMLGDVI